jgi:DNA-binding transcriptional LysR family regulator
MNDLDWTLCRSFLAVLRRGSLAQAAKQLGLTHPTLKRHLDEMERVLGVKLFTRSPDGLAPTEQALSLRGAAETMEAAHGQLVRIASTIDGQLSGTVRISASEIIGHEVLPPILTGLREKHPALAFELILSNQIEDILRRDADIAIRMARPTQAALVARLIGRKEIGLFAHATWLKTHGTPKDIQSLIKQKCLIGYDRNPAILEALRANGIKADRNAFALRSDSDLAQLAALRAGLGPGMCQVALAKPPLRRICPTIRHQLEIWLVTHADLRNTSNIRAVLDFLATKLTVYVSTQKYSLA